jgi:hypothetical protein
MIYLKIWPDVDYGDNGDEFYDETVSGNFIIKQTTIN